MHPACGGFLVVIDPLDGSKPGDFHGDATHATSAAPPGAPHPVPLLPLLTPSPDDISRFVEGELRVVGELGELATKRLRSVPSISLSFFWF